MEKLIAELKQFCLDNYEEGFDTCVECWGDEDYKEWIKDYPEVVDCNTFAKSYQFLINHRREIESTAW